jgi:hypothetical protein
MPTNHPGKKATAAAATRDFRYCCCRFAFGPGICEPCQRTYHGGCSHARLPELRAQHREIKRWLGSTTTLDLDRVIDLSVPEQDRGAVPAY